MDMTYRLHCSKPGSVLVSGAFRPNGGSAFSNSASTNTQYGVATITRNSAGNFTVALNFGGASIRNIKAGFRLSALPAAVASIMIIGAPTVSTSAISFVIQYAENNLAADIASNAANWIDWEFILDNGTVP